MRLAIAIALGLAAAPAFAAPACLIDKRAVPDKAVMFPAIVRGEATSQEILAQTATAMNRARAAMSPKYENLPRVFVFYKEGGARHGTIAAVVSGPVPKAGDQVVVASRHRDPDAPCAFIPWVVVPEKSGKAA